MGDFDDAYNDMVSWLSSDQPASFDYSHAMALAKEMQRAHEWEIDERFDMQWNQLVSQFNSDHLVRHAHELEHARKAEYHRGYTDGIKARDTSMWQLERERADAARRIGEIETDMGGFVKKLAEALGSEWFAPNPRQNKCEIKRRLVHLLTPNGTKSCVSATKTPEIGGSESAHKMTKSAEIGELYVNGTSPNGVGTCPNDGTTSSITDELRKFTLSPAMTQRLTPDEQRTARRELQAIADRIDEQFERICEQQEAVLQQTIDKMTVELDLARAKNRRLTRHIDQMQGGSRKWREKCEALAEVNADLAKGIDDARESEYRAERQRDELQAKLNDYDETHVELPKDADGEYIHIGDRVEDNERVARIVLTDGSCEPSVYTEKIPNVLHEYFCNDIGHYHAPTVEQVIHDLTLGKITESQAVERIEALNGR